MKIREKKPLRTVHIKKSPLYQCHGVAFYHWQLAKYSDHKDFNDNLLFYKFGSIKMKTTKSIIKRGLALYHSRRIHVNHTGYTYM